MFGPLEFLEKLAAITPPPEVNLIIRHGLLAPHARWRASVARRCAVNLKGLTAVGRDYSSRAED